MTVELYIQRGCKLGVLRELGYLSPGALLQWHKEFIQTRVRKNKRSKVEIHARTKNTAVDY